MATTVEEITSNAELRDALARLWIAEHECRLARLEVKQMTKEIMLPLVPLKNEIKALQPKIQAYMLKHDMQRLRSEGREFRLAARKSKRKLDVDELSALFEANDLNDTRSLNTLDDAKKSSTKITHRVVVPFTSEEPEVVVDLANIENTSSPHQQH